MNKSYEKYFVIGFNKTATTTIHQLFLKNNLNSRHTPKKWETDKYTCFTDNGHQYNYRELDLKYEDSIFILNVRELDRWLISRFKHGIRKWRKPNWAYPCTIEKCIEWIEHREKYHQEILEYFADRPNKIIIINTDKREWMNYLCSQLQFKNNKIKSRNIHVTTDSDEHKKIIEVVNKTLEELNYDKQTILFQNKELLNKYKTIYNNYI